ncbi:MAG TPA: ATP-binding protein [Burkholderiales bacterium]|nr:ATP-binding protein [Burkholderiales bacterium]
MNAPELRPAAPADAVQQELEARVAQRTSELADAVRNLEAFSYSVSHDLRTPLRAISGFAQILARRHRACLDEEGRHYLDNIVRASEQMGRLIEDLLNYSRLGRQVIRLERVDLAAVLNGLAHDFAPRLQSLGARLELPPAPLPVRGDPTLLMQIFLNLIENALTYRRPDVPAVVEVSAAIESDAITVCVADNGIGIAPEHHETIFGVFQRLHSQDEYPGTGIGLATVKRSVEMLGGNVRVESGKGTGSRFFVRLRRP